MFQFPLFLFHLQILDMDLDPDDQEMYAGEEGNTRSTFILSVQSPKNWYSLVSCV